MRPSAGQAELLGHVNEALQSYPHALELFPNNAVNKLAVTHTALGAIDGDVGDLDRALVSMAYINLSRRR